MVSSENRRDNSQEISKHPWTYSGLDTLGYQASTLSLWVHVFLGFAEVMSVLGLT